jgi:molybdopterin converting factor small subunit
VPVQLRASLAARAGRARRLLVDGAAEQATLGEVAAWLFEQLELPDGLDALRDADVVAVRRRDEPY